MAINTGCNTQPVTLVELVLDVCDLTFGQGACGGSGIQCFNMYSSCPRKCDYSCSEKSFWFSSCGVKLPPHFEIYNYTPNIQSVTHDATRLEIGKTFSTRGRIKICFEDAADNDANFDPYFPRGATKILCAEDVPGSLWGRLIARYKYFENRQVNVYTGYCDQAFCDLDVQRYFISSLVGPDDSCKVTMTLKDPLVYTESALCPSGDDKLVAQQITGNEFALPMTLATNLDGIATESEPEADQFAEVNKYLLANNYASGISTEQDQCFNNLRHICIGDEVLEVRAEINPSVPVGWNIVLLDRGICGSEIGPHEAGATITLAETLQGKLSGVLCRLLQCAGVEQLGLSCCEDDPKCIIDWASFKQLDCDMPLVKITDEVIICKGVAVKTLLNELSTEFMFFLYYDAATGKIKAEAFSPPECNEDIVNVNECDIVKGTFKVKQTDKYYNVVEYLHTQADCTEGVDEDNLVDSTVSVAADALLEPCARNEHKNRQTLTIKSRWISKSNRYLAKAGGDRYLRLKSCAGKEVSFQVRNDFSRTVELGKYSKIWHPKLQDIYGGYDQSYWLLKGKAPALDCTTLTYQQVPFDSNLANSLNCDTECATFPIDDDDCETQDCVGLW